MAWFKNERFRVTLSKLPFQGRNRNRYRNRLSSIRTMVAPKAFLDPDVDIDFDPDTLLPWFEPGRKITVERQNQEDTMKLKMRDTVKRKGEIAGGK